MSDSVRELLGKERAALSELYNLLDRLDADEADLASLKTALSDLEGVFMLVVVGEYNAGKSSLLNALLGDKVMLEGVTPTTDRVTVVTYGDEAKEIDETHALARREFPADILKDLAIVDTPGTNAVIREHQELTERFVPRSDLVLFVTSADRPFTESERGFLELIGSWGKKIVIIVNKMDIIEAEDERAKVMDFVREHARKTLGVQPQVFALKAKDAFRAKTGDGNLAGTGLPELESYIESVLSVGERTKLKLANPLGVAQRLADTYQDVVANRLELLQDDRKTLSEVDRQLTQYQKDMKREVDSYIARVKTVLLEVERRGDVYFDETVRLSNVIGLMNTSRVKENFENNVVRGADQQIDNAVSELVDWFITRNLNLWEDVVNFVAERRKARDERVIGEVGGRFQYDRGRLIGSLRQSAEDVLEGYDENAESRRLADKLQSAVFQSGGIAVSGLGLGAGIALATKAAILDLTGITAGILAAGIGLYVIPRQRQKAKLDLHEKMQELRDGLETSISKQFDDELQKATTKLNDSIEPYTRFVRSELTRLDELETELETTEGQLSQLRTEVDRLEPASSA